MEERYISRGVSAKVKSSSSMVLAFYLVATAVIIWLGFEWLKDHRYNSRDEWERLLAYLVMLSPLPLTISQVIFCANRDNFYVKIFDDHLEALCVSSGLFVVSIKTMHVNYVNIGSLEVKGENLSLMVSGKREQLICDDVQKVYELLSRLIQDAQRGPGRSGPVSSSASDSKSAPKSGPLNRGSACCSQCGTVQNADRDKCYNCGAPLKSE